jgi:hypothetical protein
MKHEVVPREIIADLRVGNTVAVEGELYWFSPGREHQVAVEHIYRLNPIA